MSPTATAAYRNWRNLAVGVLVALAFAPVGIASAAEQTGIESRVLESIPLGRASKIELASLSAGVLYSNFVSNSGFHVLNGGATLASGNIITRLVADDITPAAGFSGSVTEIKYSVVNTNNVAVSARVSLRFWNDSPGQPGTYYNSFGDIGFTFNAASFPANTTSLVTATIDKNIFVAPTGKFWCGMTFDNNIGLTGATAPQLDKLGQAIFLNPTSGTSEDEAFRTDVAGSFFGDDNPAGALLGAGPEAPHKFALRFSTDGLTGSTKSTWSRVKQLYR